MILNGKKVTYEAGITVQELLNKIELSSDKVVIEVDKDIVSKDEYPKKKLNGDSKVEIVRFVGGG